MSWNWYPSGLEPCFTLHVCIIRFGKASVAIDVENFLFIPVFYLIKLGQARVVRTWIGTPSIFGRSLKGYNSMRKLGDGPQRWLRDLPSYHSVFPYTVLLQVLLLRFTKLHTLFSLRFFTLERRAVPLFRWMMRT